MLGDNLHRLMVEMGDHLYNGGEQTFNSIKSLQKGNSYVGSRQAFLSLNCRLFFVGLAVIFLVSNAYVMFRMTIAQSKLERVSVQLGYTSDRLVTEGLSFGELNPFIGSQQYIVVRYFTTSLNASALQTRLQEIRLNPRRQRIDESALLITYNALVDGTPVQVLKAQGSLPIVPRYCWELNIARIVCLEEISVLKKSIELKGKELSGNVVGLSISGVRVQLWMLPGLTLWANLQGYRL